MKKIQSYIIAPIVLSGCLAGTSMVAGNTDIPNGYLLNLTPHPHGFRYSVEGEPVRAGIVSERYELRDGDCGDADCRNNGSRSEIRLAPTATQARFGEDIWYGWSLYNENISSYPQSTSLMNVFGQWKQGGSNPPSVKLVQIGRGEAYRSGNRNHDVVIQLDDANENFGWGESKAWGIVCRLFSIDGARGRWTDIVMNTNFSTGDDGYLRIWIDGQQRCDYQGPLIASTDRSLYPGPNHRRGIYIGSSERWDRAQLNVPKPTMITFYDEFRIGRTRQDVDIRMIEQAAVAPVD